MDDDGRTLLKKDERTGKRRPLSQEEIDDIVWRKNTEGRYDKKNHYEIDGDGTVLTVSNKDPKKRKPIQQRYQKSFLKGLNTKVDSLGKHFTFVNDKPVLKVNATRFVDDGSVGDAKYKKLRYRNVRRDDIDLALRNLDSGEKKPGGKPRDVYGYEDGRFTVNGKDMTQRQFDEFVRVLNGGVGKMYKLLNPKAWGKKEEEYWSSYKISEAGSKVGAALNFNLPPIETCHVGWLPCKRKCYAVKAYG